MAGGSNIVSGERRTVVPLYKGFLPLPAADHLFMLAAAIIPMVFLYRFGNLPEFNSALPVISLTAYMAIRMQWSKHRYKNTPTLEVADGEIVLPYSHFSDQQERLLYAEAVERIEFFRGVGQAKKVETYMILTDSQGRTFKITAFHIDMRRLKEAVEVHGWQADTRPNPKRLAHLGAILLGAGLVSYWLYGML